MKTENDELRQLDAWIAEHVMGWTPNKSQSLKYRRAWNIPGQELRWTGEARLPELYECDHPEDEMFRPTTNDADAMAVLKVCAETVSPNDILIFTSELEDKQVWSVYQNGDQRGDLCDTLPLAICRFAKALFEK